MKILGKDASFKVGGTAYPCFDLAIEVSADEVDVTDLESTGDYREFLSGFKNGTLTFNSYLNDTAVPIQAGASGSFEAVFGAYKMTGNMIINKRGLGTSVDGAVKVDVSARMTGAPTEVIVT